MKWKVASIYVTAALAVDSDRLTAAIQAKVNQLRHDWAGLQPIVKTSATLMDLAQSAADISAQTCTASQPGPVVPVTGYDVLGQTQWACEGSHCFSLPLDQPAEDWANQGACYQYAPLGEADVSCAGAYVYDFTQLFWDSVVVEGEGSDAKYLGAPPTSIGCAAQRCSSVEGMVVVCHYGPGGNTAGEVPFSDGTLAQLANRFPGMNSGSTTTTTVAPKSTTSPDQEIDREWLEGVVDSINSRRYEVGKLPPLRVNEDLVQYAQSRANQNAAVCSSQAVGDGERSDIGHFALVGETMWACVGECNVNNGLLAVADWCKQAECYQYAPFGSPDQQSPTSTFCSYQTTFHDFTQIFWTTEVDERYGSATDVGCGRAFCTDENGNFEKSFQMICSYGPAGNAPDEYPFSEATAAEIAKVHKTVFPPV